MTTDPTFYVMIAAAGLAGLGMVTMAILSGWRGWLALKHQELTHRTPSAGDEEEHTVQTRTVASANNTLGVHAFVAASLGISVLPDYLVDEDIAAGRLVALLPRFRLPEGGVYAVYPGKQPPVKVRAFIDLLKERLAGPSG